MLFSPHLEPVTPRLNVLRSPIHPAALARTNPDRCAQGHDMADAYRYADGKKRCRPCALASNKRAYLKRAGRTGSVVSTPYQEAIAA